MRVENAPSTASPVRRVQDAPWTVMAYAVVSVLGMVVWTVLDGQLTRSLVASLVEIGLVIGLVKGYRAALAIALAFAALSLIGVGSFIADLVTGGALRPKDYVAWSTWAITTALLLHPLTRTWASR